MVTKAIESSGNNEWETPPEIYQHWNDKFQFDLDVCATKRNAKCFSYFSKEYEERAATDDAQCVGVDAVNPATRWWERNWMNPPYGRGMILPFVKKASEQAEEGRLTVGLLPVATSTRWWQEYVARADYVYFYPYRINFLRDGVVVKGVAFDPCVVIWGLNPDSTKGSGGPE